jgi:four helix bundle protein
MTNAEPSAMTSDENAVRVLEPDSARSDGASKTTTFDLEERTARFGEDIIRFALTVRLNPVTSPLVSQLVRAGTTIGSNYCEADDAGSKKEFRYRISVCRRESRESKYWLRMMAVASPENREDARALWREAKELNLIFAAIYRRSAPE